MDPMSSYGNLSNSIFNNDHYNLNYHSQNAPTLSLFPNPLSYTPQMPLNTPEYSAPPFTPSLLPEIHHPGTAGLGLLTGSVKAFLKAEEIEIPRGLKTIGLVASSAITGKKLAGDIQDALDQGQTPAEAYLCQTAKTLMDEASQKTLKGAVTGGIPAYLTLASTSVPLALTVPFVAPMIPAAYQGAQMTAKAAGAMTEHFCHKGFDFARHLTRKQE